MHRIGVHSWSRELVCIAVAHFPAGLDGWVRQDCRECFKLYCRGLCSTALAVAFYCTKLYSTAWTVVFYRTELYYTALTVLYCTGLYSTTVTCTPLHWTWTIFYCTSLLSTAQCFVLLHWTVLNWTLLPQFCRPARNVKKKMHSFSVWIKEKRKSSTPLFWGVKEMELYFVFYSISMNGLLKTFRKSLLSLIHSLIYWVILLLRIFQTLSIPNHRSQGGEILRECSAPTMWHISHVTCYMSNVPYFFSSTTWWS